MTVKIDRLINKPLVISAKSAHHKKIIVYRKDGTATVNLKGKKVFKIPKSGQYDLTQATIFGLNERITMSALSPLMDQKGTTLRDEFNEEWERYNKSLIKARNFVFDYGYYAFFLDKKHLVRFSNPYWHKIVSVASSSKLIADPEKKLSWKEIRKIFEGKIIGVAGCSVGSNIIHSIVMDMRPNNIKIADKSVYKMENINRVRLGYDNFVQNNQERKNICDLSLKNKAEVVAKQIYEIDPFINVYVYNEGINADNISDFFKGNKKEPPIDFLVEEIDDPRIKILVRQEARKRKIPVLMMTDVGSAVQLDFLRYDLDQNLPLAIGSSDEKLLESMENFYQRAGDKQAFYAFCDTLIGTDYRQGELADILDEKCEIPTSTIIPQLGSTAALAGAIAAEQTARFFLGHDCPRRVYFNKKTFEVKM